jgi:hypothetical protein
MIHRTYDKYVSPPLTQCSEGWIDKHVRELLIKNRGSFCVLENRIVVVVVGVVFSSDLMTNHKQGFI